MNRPYQESSSIISGSEVLKSSNKTTYNGNYGLNAQWTVYNGSKRLKTIEQEKLNNRVADLDVATSENDIEQSIAQVYIQILYAAESVKVNENTLQVSEAQRTVANNCWMREALPGATMPSWKPKSAPTVINW